MSKGDPLPTGWCMTGHHDRCPVTIFHSDRQIWKTCICTCHRDEEPQVSSGRMTRDSRSPTDE